MHRTLFNFRLAQSALNNEFLTKACHEWKERLLRGDFTSESLQRAKADIEKDKSNVDPWKVMFVVQTPYFILQNFLFQYAKLCINKHLLYIYFPDSKF